VCEIFPENQFGNQAVGNQMSRLFEQPLKRVSGAGYTAARNLRLAEGEMQTSNAAETSRMV
jgi:hypothetical protein